MQTTLTRIFIVLESVSHGLSENSDEISLKARKFEGFFRPKSGGLRKKRCSPKLRLIFRPKFEIQRFFPPKIRWSPKKKKKKRSSPKLRLIFRPKSEIQRIFPPKIRWSPKNKVKVFTKIETDFSAEIRNSNV